MEDDTQLDVDTSGSDDIPDTPKKDKPIAGIYQLVFSGDNRVYTGRSKDIYARYREHVRMLEAGTHHNHKMQRFYVKGETKVFLTVLEGYRYAPSEEQRAQDSVPRIFQWNVKRDVDNLKYAKRRRS